MRSGLIMDYNGEKIKDISDKNWKRVTSKDLFPLPLIRIIAGTIERVRSVHEM